MTEFETNFQLTAMWRGLNRQGQSGYPKRAAAVHFAKKLIETRGRVGDAEFAAMREAGFSDTQILEIVALYWGGSRQRTLINREAAAESGEYRAAGCRRLPIRA